MNQTFQHGLLKNLYIRPACTRTMAEDLVIDIGIPPNTKEFDSFVRCIQNILQYGCGYDDDFTEEILEKCRKSELDIAKQVISELEKPRSQYERRKSKLKWWEEYRPKRKSANGSQTDRRHRDQRSPFERPNHTNNRQRLKSGMFERSKRKRPISPMFERSKRKRPMSPMFGGSESKRTPQNVHHKRPMSPIWNRHDCNSDVPEWQTKNKKRRFR